MQKKTLNRNSQSRLYNVLLYRLFIHIVQCTVL